MTEFHIFRETDEDMMVHAEANTNEFTKKPVGVVFHETVASIHKFSTTLAEIKLHVIEEYFVFDL